MPFHSKFVSVSVERVGWHADLSTAGLCNWLYLGCLAQLLALDWLLIGLNGLKVHLWSWTLQNMLRRFALGIEFCCLELSRLVPLIATCKGLSLTTCWGSNCTHTWPCLRDHTELEINFEVALKKKKGKSCLNVTVVTSRAQWASHNELWWLLKDFFFFLEGLRTEIAQLCCILRSLRGAVAKEKEKANKFFIKCFSIHIHVFLYCLVTSLT